MGILVFKCGSSLGSLGSLGDDLRPGHTMPTEVKTYRLIGTLGQVAYNQTMYNHPNALECPELDLLG